MAIISKIQIPGSDSAFGIQSISSIYLSDATDVANITVTTTKTKGVDPYNTNYYYTNLTVDTTKVNLTEADLENGVIIGIQLVTAVGSSYRNVRIQFGSSGTYYPFFDTTAIMSGSSYMSAGQFRQFVFSTSQYSTGAFHIIHDNNNTYTIGSLGGGYGTCTTEEATTAKIVTNTSYSLAVGGLTTVKFTYAVPADATMNINSKGAKAIYYQGSAITANVIKAGDLATFVYDGTNYCLLHTDTSSGASAGEKVDLSSYSAGDTIPAATALKLADWNNTAYYENDYYRIVTDTTVEGTRMILFAALNSSDGGGGFYVSLTSGATDWIFSGAIEIAMLGYDANGVLKIKLDNTNKAFKLTETATATETEIRKNAGQTGSIILNLPATSGTLALTSDINSTNIIAGLGYTPYNATNPDGYITGIDSADVVNALGYTPYNSNNPSHFITGITSSDVTTALGYTPYDSTNPNEYISGINSGDVTTALGYTPYNATNPNGYISGITSSDVTTALGYTPYNSTNPDNYITANASNLNNYYTKTAVDGMVANRFQARIVTALPTTGISTSTIYMIADSTVENSYDEYMYIEETWVKIGETAIDMSEYAKIDDLHNVALTGAYSSLVGKPTIPDSTSDLTNDSGFITKSVNNLDNYTLSSDLATVATTGAYSDLSGTPTIPTAVSSLTNDSGYIRTADLATTNISSLYNDVPYATLSEIQGLKDIDVEEIKKAIAAMEHIGTVTQVTAGTGLTGGGNTTVTLNHSNAVTAVSGYPSGTTLENGGSFTVRDAQYDAQGHITGSQDRVITMATIPAYDDTAVRTLITNETTARTATDTRVSALENMWTNEFTSFVFCIFGIEQYIDPSTMQPVADRYYQRSDVDTGIFMDSEKIDIHLKAWLKYHYNITTLDKLKNLTCYVYAMGDHGIYVNHMVTFWSQMTNSLISSYPHLQQVGMFVDDGYGSVHRFTTSDVGAILSSSDDGYIAADPLGTGKGYVSGWNTLTGRVTTLEDTIGDINDALDAINGEVI